MELGGVGWSWVEVGAQFINTVRQIEFIKYQNGKHLMKIQLHLLLI